MDNISIGVQNIFNVKSGACVLLILLITYIIIYVLQFSIGNAIEIYRNGYSVQRRNNISVFFPRVFFPPETAWALEVGFTYIIYYLY